MNQIMSHCKVVIWITKWIPSVYREESEWIYQMDTEWSPNGYTEWIPRGIRMESEWILNGMPNGTWYNQLSIDKKKRNVIYV